MNMQRWLFKLHAEAEQHAVEIEKRRQMCAIAECESALDRHVGTDDSRRKDSGEHGVAGPIAVLHSTRGRRAQA